MPKATERSPLFLIARLKVNGGIDKASIGTLTIYLKVGGGIETLSVEIIIGKKAEELVSAGWYLVKRQKIWP